MKLIFCRVYNYFRISVKFEVLLEVFHFPYPPTLGGEVYSVSWGRISSCEGVRNIRAAGKKKEKRERGRNIICYDIEAVGKNIKSGEGE